MAEDVTFCGQCADPIPGGQAAYVWDGAPACEACYRDAKRSAEVAEARRRAAISGAAPREMPAPWSGWRWFKVGFFITLGVIAAQAVLAFVALLVFLALLFFGIAVGSRGSVAPPATGGTSGIAAPLAAPAGSLDPEAANAIRLTVNNFDSGSNMTMRVVNTSTRPLAAVIVVTCASDPSYRRMLDARRVDPGDAGIVFYEPRPAGVAPGVRVDCTFEVTSAKFHAS